MAGGGGVTKILLTQLRYHRSGGDETREINRAGQPSTHPHTHTHTYPPYKILTDPSQGGTHTL